MDEEKNCIEYKQTSRDIQIAPGYPEIVDFPHGNSVSTSDAAKGKGLTPSGRD